MSLDASPFKDISWRTGLAPSTLTNVLDKMEEKRLVRRRHVRRDRRMVMIELDVSGRRVRKKFNNLVREISAGLMEGLPERDREDFASILKKSGRFFYGCSGESLDGSDTVLGHLQTTLAGRFRRK